MTVERIVRTFAGFVILMSLALGMTASPVYQNTNWLWLTAFVGANLFQSGLTNFCLLAVILTRLGVKQSCKVPA